ncbi:tRNA lysidine(34) synthetase TilS [Tabrizicola aquatica]|uniref:tRNA lysidine(34) synthetase TilS n=1 Tax=Tabrizicola aquatica TaxID=909926 RepID=UPI000CD247B6|nr:tRNA lysidine(34) synthetase TilS [Tabrizicola aquatica]
MPVDGRLVGLVRTALPAGETIGVAVSGGGDSTALLHLCLAAGLRVEAVTVDHRLRAESAAEAVGVAALCRRLGVPHQVQVWDHGAIAGNLMDAARRARVGLILAWAQERGIAHVALGHTQDDQAETLLMGLARAAGIAGLSGMRPQWDEGGVTFHRPLLGAGREELRDWLRQRGVAWVEDPTNRDDRYQRVKARQALAALAPLGITVDGLATVASNLAQVQAALAVQVAAFARHLREAAGALQVDPALWDAPEEVRRQVIVAALRWLSGAEYAPRAAEVLRFMAAMQAGRDATLAGCRHRNGWLLREARALRGLEAGLWDGRWQVAGPGEVRALGAEGLRQCDWRATGLPREVLAVTPAFWDGDRLVAAPSAGFGNSRATILRPFHLFGLSD